MFQNYQESGPYLLASKERKIGARFRMAPSNTVLANTLRRQIMSAVPSVGFRTEPAEESEVVIEANTTPLVAEMIAHRIGMIPIRADPATFDPARYEFRINKENTGKTMIDVSAADFVIVERDPSNPLDEGRIVPTGDFFPPDPITGETCLITRLRPQWNPIAPNERLVLKARAAVSTGTENSRWTPVSQCSYENTRDDNPERLEAMFQNWATISKKVDNEATRREFDTMEVQRCFRINEAGEPNDFTFYMESVGVQAIPDIVRSGIEQTIDLLTKYQDIDAEIPESVLVQHANTRFSAVEFVFRGEGHTLGNLLQYYINENHIEGAEEPRITYAGYKVPHPLKKEMVLVVGGVEEGELSDPEEELQTARFVVAKVIRFIKGVFRQMLEDWKGAVGMTDIAMAVEEKQDAAQLAEMKEAATITNTNPVMAANMAA
jgi:DNA-directed RNA polymerase subunit L